MKHAIDVEYSDGGTVTFYAESKNAADDFAERTMESGPAALSAIVRTIDPSEDFDSTEEQTKGAQCDLILAFMKRNGSITQWESTMEIGCMRLSARIYDLRGRGYNITSTMIKHNGKRFAQYRLKDNPCLDSNSIR